MKQSIKKYKVEVLLFLGVFIAFLAPAILTQPAIFAFLNFSGTGQIGDTIGGTVGPILNFVGLVLLYYSFREQFIEIVSYIINLIKIRWQKHFYFIIESTNLH
jgi:hypothetical protein